MGFKLLSFLMAFSSLALMAKNPIVSMATSKGEIRIELEAEKAPKTVKNFLKYVKDKKYNGTIFHRVIDNFMIQGGGFTPDMKKVATYSAIENEAKNGLKNTVGTIAMARTQAKDSATNQFFINLKDNSFLDYASGKDGYAVFGKVVKGMRVINVIKKVKKAPRGGGHNDVPVENIVIKSVTLL